jgi:hypothetical protein
VVFPDGHKVSLKLATQFSLLCAGVILAACTPQIPPIVQDNKVFISLKKASEKPNNDNEEDETSLLATETVDPEADETSVTIIVRPKHSEDMILETLPVEDKSEAEPNGTVVSSFKQYLHPDAFTGRRALEVQMKIGLADFIRHEGSVMTWQYRMPSCVIDLFILFETTEFGSMHSLPSDKLINSHFIRSRIHNLAVNETKCLEEFSQRLS